MAKYTDDNIAHALDYTIIVVTVIAAAFILVAISNTIATTLV